MGIYKYDESSFTQNTAYKPDFIEFTPEPFCKDVKNGGVDFSDIKWVGYLEIGPFVKILEKDKKELDDKYGKAKIDEIIEEMNDYLLATGKRPYNDYAAAIRMWIRNQEKYNYNKTITNINYNVTPEALNEKPVINTTKNKKKSKWKSIDSLKKE